MATKKNIKTNNTVNLKSDDSETVYMSVTRFYNCVLRLEVLDTEFRLTELEPRYYILAHGRIKGIDGGDTN